MEYKHEGQAEYDGRQYFMTRLHNAILHSHNSMFNNDYEGWFKALTVLRIELSSHVRTEEEKELLKKSVAKLTDLLFNVHNKLNKLQGFIEVQENLHSIMRKRGFDVPINEFRPGSSVR